MQPSNQLKGLVESYGQVGSTDYHEYKKIEKTLVNAIGVQMVSEGYTEVDVEEFLSEASDAKLLAKFKEALQNESVTAYITEDGTFDTKLRYVEGAVHARLDEQGGRTMRNRMRGGVSVDGLVKGAKSALRGIRDFVNPPRSKSADPVVRAGGSYTASGGGPVLPGSSSGSKSTPAAKAPPFKGPGGDPSGSGQGQAQQRSKAAPKSRIDTTITPKAKPAAPVVKPVKTVKVDGKKMTDAQIRAEYDRKRYSKDPKVKASAKDFGMKASKARFGTAGTKDFGDKRESAELDLVLQHLVSEGIADTLQGALVMVEGMSDQFINSIIEQAQMGSAMVEFLIQNGEAESIEEAQYIISELDEENIDLLIQSITEGGMTLLGGKRGYVRYGGPEKKGDQKVSGIGPFGTYARKSEGSTGGTKTKSQTMKMTSDGKPRKY